MTKNRKDGDVDEVRRKLLRTSIVLGGAFAAGQIPYSRPEAKSFFGVRSAWAQPSVMFSFEVSFGLSLPAPPGMVCQNAIIQNIMVQVTPTPPTGTVMRCTPTTDDPANSTLPTTTSTTAPTNATGGVMFAKIDLTGNVPNPPLAIGSTLTLTVTFNDPATFGSASGSVNLVVIAAC